MQKVCLQVGVSAGGWLARLALGSVPYDGHTFGLSPLVHTLVTLGTPHQSLEAYPLGRAEVRLMGLTAAANAACAGSITCLCLFRSSWLLR